MNPIKFLVKDWERLLKWIHFKIFFFPKSSVVQTGVATYILSIVLSLMWRETLNLNSIETTGCILTVHIRQQNKSEIEPTLSNQYPAFAN